MGSFFPGSMGFEQMEENEIGELLDVVHHSRQMLTVRFRSRTKTKDIVKNGGEESWGSPIGAMNTLGEICEDQDWKATRISGYLTLSEPSPSHPCDAMGLDDLKPPRIQVVAHCRGKLPRTSFRQHFRFCSPVDLMPNRDWRIRSRRVKTLHLSPV